MTIKLHNSLTGSKETFKPVDPESGKVGMYVCGPTVYNRPHLGNARSVVVYDVLYRLLCHEYGEDNITYVRNITDVDDKINKAAKENGETIGALTKRITQQFHDDMEALNCLRPTHEPKATENIDNIIKLIEKIIKNGGAYEAEGHVLFDVKAFSELADEEEPFCCSDPHHNHDKDFENDYFYGKLSGKKLEDLRAGARVEVESYKKNPEDFVLWKPADKEDDESSKFESPWGVGRPGWHIECSAMSTNILGENFDIHGGGADLKFPHHENEIAQSVCGNHGSKYAKFWVHNGFLTVNGEKMSKSLGNFTTVKELLDKDVDGEVIRLALLSAHYRKPLDFNEKLIEDSKKTLGKFLDSIVFFINSYPHQDSLTNEEEQKNIEIENEKIFQDFEKAIKDDMNFPLAISFFYKLQKSLRSYNCTEKAASYFFNAAEIIGLCYNAEKILDKIKSLNNKNFNEAEIQQKIDERIKAKKNKDFATADKIRDELTSMGVTIKDHKDGTDWELE